MARQKTTRTPAPAAAPRMRSVLLALCWYDYRIHRGVARYAREHGWLLHSEMGHTGVIPWGWQGDGVICATGGGNIHAVYRKFIQGLDAPSVSISSDCPEIDIPRVQIGRAHV